jgi:hypothetical protein
LQFLFEEWVIASTFPIFLLLIIILKVANDFFLLVFGEHLNFRYLRISQLHPRVRQYLLRRQSFHRIRLQDLLKNTKCALRNVSRRSPTALHVDDLLLQLAHVGGLERHCTEQHGVEHDSGTPHIGLEAAVAFALEHFGCDVSRCTTLFMLYLILALNKFAHAKVTDLDIALRSEQDVVQFDVSMEHALAVHVHQALDQLAEDVLREVFLELPSSTDIRQQVAAAADFHDVDGVRVRVEALVQAHDVLVAGALQNVVLLHDLFEGALIRHVSLVDGFQRNELASEAVDGQVHLTKRSFAYHFADFVVVYLRLEDLVGDVREDVVQNQFPWCQLASIKVRLLDDSRCFLRPVL